MFCTGDAYCNCEDCCWSRDGEQICPCCGCLESSCPETDPILYQVWLESFDNSVGE
jgi:hypothetical protein